MDPAQYPRSHFQKLLQSAASGWVEELGFRMMSVGDSCKRQLLLFCLTFQRLTLAAIMSLRPVRLVLCEPRGSVQPKVTLQTVRMCAARGKISGVLVSRAMSPAFCCGQCLDLPDAILYIYSPSFRVAVDPAERHHRVGPQNDTLGRRSELVFQVGQETCGDESAGELEPGYGHLLARCDA